jgi:hypothetical protein
VVGSQGRNAVGRLVLGSVSLKVLSEAACSVRVARHSSAETIDENSPQRIVIGIDGSPDSRVWRSKKQPNASGFPNPKRGWYDGHRTG